MFDLFSKICYVLINKNFTQKIDDWKTEFSVKVVCVLTYHRTLLQSGAHYIEVFKTCKTLASTIEQSQYLIGI